MAITFNCPCGKVLSTRDRDAGLRAICPSCGRRLVVPGQIQVPDEPQEQLRTLALKFDRWIHSNHRNIAWAAVAAGAVLAGAMLGYQWFKNARTKRLVQNAPVATVVEEQVRLDPNADPEQWRTNFDSFAVAARTAIRNNELLQEKFTGQQIDWEVTFQGLLERNALYFREAEPLRETDRGIYVWAMLLPSQIEKAERFQRGQRIRIRGTMGPVLTGRSLEHELGYTSFRPLECKVEAIDSEAADLEEAAAADLKDDVDSGPGSAATGLADPDSAKKLPASR